MTDERAEQAFRTALATRATAFEPEDRELPAAHRRRRWPAVLAAAAVVLAIVLIGALRPHGHQEVPSPARLPDGWRWESHANVMVAVPGTWGYAAAPGSDWCAATGRHAPPAQGYVDTRTSDVVLGILCGGTPALGLTAPHLSFSDALGDEIPLPEGWVRVRDAVGVTHLVVTIDTAHRALADQILSTAHVFTADMNGCPPASPIQDQHLGRPNPPFDVDTLDGVDSISVCQYQLGVTGPGLIASQLLTGRAADAELHALQSAPTGGGPARQRNCDNDRGPTGSTLLLTSGGQTHEMYAVYSGCRANGIDDGTQVRALTRSNCSPLFGPRVIDTEGIRSAFEKCAPPDGN